MEFKKHIMLICTKEPIEIRQAPDGRTVCPVCGTLGWSSPYVLGWDDDGNPILEKDQATRPQYATASQDICGSCHTHFGDTDTPPSRYEIWAQLRRQWLERPGKSKDAIEQLKNLDIFLDLRIEWQTCACCGYKTTAPGYEVCAICHWMKDPAQEADPDLDPGTNGLSLRQAQRNYREFGAAANYLVEVARKPTEQEEKERDPNWKPLE